MLVKKSTMRKSLRTTHWLGTKLLLQTEDYLLRYFMEILEQLAMVAPQKLDELAALHWFTQSERIDYDEILTCESGLVAEERPDFRLRIGNKTVGLEITVAQRPIAEGKFSAQQIEAAQNDFAKALEQAMRPALPVIVTLAFNDEIAVVPKKSKAALPVIVDKIEELTRSMEPRSGVMLVRIEDKVAHYPNAHVCPEIPEFLQNIGFYNDGQNFSAVTASRGGITEPFTEADLNPILQKKHEALKGYRRCDEHWLVIVSGMVPPIFPTKERPTILLPSSATNFADAEIVRPIRSDFDRVYFFRSPTHALNLTEAP